MTLLCFVKKFIALKKAGRFVDSLLQKSEIEFRGIRYSCFDGRERRERLKEAEETREEFLREYHIANIRKHAPRNVLASLWWLERRVPGRFALRPVHRVEGSTDQPIGDQVPEERLREYGRQMLEFAH